MCTIYLGWKHQGKAPQGPTEGSLRRTQLVAKKLSKPAQPMKDNRRLVGESTPRHLGHRMTLRLGMDKLDGTFVGRRGVDGGRRLRPAVFCRVSTNPRVLWGFHLAFLKLFGQFLKGTLGIISGSMSRKHLYEFIILKSKLKTPKELSKKQLKIEGSLEPRG